tara:strand:+ start:50829 stop:51533 length:705 start_codon:yes stop_codon:yes gene_type:complete
MKIGLDWSGVIADVHEARRLILMELHGTFENGAPVMGPFSGNDGIVPFSPEYRKMFEDVVSGRTPVFAFTKDWVLEDKSQKEDGTLLSISLEEYEAMKEVLYERSEYAENIPEIPGALEGIKELLEEGHDVSIVTSRGRGLPAEVVRNWCKAHDLHLPTIFGAKDKTRLLVKYDLFVDDKKRQLIAEGDDSLATVRMLFMHRYNTNEITDFISKDNCGYIADWAGLLKWIRARK